MSASIAIPTLPSSSKSMQRTPKSVGSPSGSSYSQSPASSLASTPSSAMKAAPRRPSLLGDAFAKEESRVINIGDPEGPPRLISYLSSSQGFDWNPEIFLPSYIDCDYTPLENRREPVHEIRLTDEESKNMLPQ